MCRQSGVTQFSSARKQWTRSRVVGAGWNLAEPFCKQENTDVPAGWNLAEPFCKQENTDVPETVLFLIQYTSKEFDRLETTVATGDCCYLNPLVRRTFRFLEPSASLRASVGLSPVVTRAISQPETLSRPQPCEPSASLRASAGLSPVVTGAMSQPETLSRPQPCGDQSHQPA
ncbi:unnamed protein product [Boreogadus saida]